MGRPLRQESMDSSSDSDSLGTLESVPSADMLSEENFGTTPSLFCSETFRSAKECWTFMENMHQFSLQRIQQEFGDQWTSYHKIRLINHLRRLGPEKARVASLALDEPFWTSDDALVPVLADDLLLCDCGDSTQEGSDVELVDGVAMEHITAPTPLPQSVLDEHEDVVMTEDRPPLGNANFMRGKGKAVPERGIQGI